MKIIVGLDMISFFLSNTPSEGWETNDSYCGTWQNSIVGSGGQDDDGKDETDECEERCNQEFLLNLHFAE